MIEQAQTPTPTPEHQNEYSPTDSSVSRPECVEVADTPPDIAHSLAETIMSYRYARKAVAGFGLAASILGIGSGNVNISGANTFKGIDETKLVRAEAAAQPLDGKQKEAALYKRYRLFAGLNTAPGQANKWVPNKRNWKLHAWIEPDRTTGKDVYKFKLRGASYGALEVIYNDPNSILGYNEKFPSLTKRAKTGGFYKDKLGTAIGVTFFANPK